MTNLVFSPKNLYEMRDIEIIFTVMCSLTHKVFLYMQANNFYVYCTLKKILNATDEDDNFLR